MRNISEAFASRPHSAKSNRPRSNEGRYLRKRPALVALISVAVAFTGACSPGAPEVSETIATSAAPIRSAQPITPSPTPTPTPTTLGTRSYDVAEIIGNQRWVGGPRARLFAASLDSERAPLEPFTLFADCLDAPWSPTVTIPELHTAQKQLFAVEQSSAAPARAAHVILGLKAGIGLSRSSYVLTIALADAATQEVTTSQYDVPVPADTTYGPHMDTAQMSNGIVVVSISWGEQDPDDTRSSIGKVHRAAYASTGTLLWERTDTQNQSSFLRSDVPNPVLDDKDIIVGTGIVVFGLQEHYVGVNIATGEEIYRKPGPYSGGLVFQTEDVFIVDAYNQGGYGDGLTAIRIADGEPFGITSAEGLVYDPVGKMFAAVYAPEREGGWGCSNCPSFDPNKPALEVRDMSGGQVFALSVEDAAGLGALKLGFAFDQRMAVYIDDGIRVVSMTTGEPTPGFETIAPGVKHVRGEPLDPSEYISFAATDATLGYRQLLVSDQPLSWSDFSLTLAGAD